MSLLESIDTGLPGRNRILRKLEARMSFNSFFTCVVNGVMPMSSSHRNCVHALSLMFPSCRTK